MEKVFDALLSQYGVMGLFIAALFWYIIRIQKSHATERKEMRTEMTRVAERGIDAQVQNTSVLSALKVLLETNLKK